MSRKTLQVAVAVLVVLGGVLGWNMAWRIDDVPLTSPYGTVRVYKVRTHLITGRSEKLTAYGWLPLNGAP